MNKVDEYTVQLENFEGPLEFLLYLVQKEEIDLSDIRLQAITDHFLRELQSLDFEQGAEFIGTAASLVWLKSRMLLPKEKQESDEEEAEGLDPHFDVIHQLIDYCRFKQAGKELVVREHEQHSYYPRGGGSVAVKQPLGIEHLSLDDLASLFQDILENAAAKSGEVFEESFRVSDAMKEIRERIGQGQNIFFEELFHTEKVRDELIVTFLAVLELMKVGDIAVIKKEDQIMLTAPLPQDSTHEPRD